MLATAPTKASARVLMKEYLWGNIGEDRWKKTFSQDELEQLLLADIGDDRDKVKITHHDDGSVSIEWSSYQNTRQQ